MPNTRAGQADIGQPFTDFQASVPTPQVPSRGTPDTAGDWAKAGSAFEGLSNQLGALADRATETEGTAAGKVAGLEADYRPSGDGFSIRGRAFNTAATSTYLTTLQTNSREALNKAYDAYTDLPVSQQRPSDLAANFQKIQGQFEQDHVFPEIKGAFREHFSSLGATYLRAAHQTFVSNQVDQSKASLIGDLGSLNTTQARIAALPPGPDADAQLGRLEGQRRAKIAAAVDGGIITAVQGQKMGADGEQDVLLQRAKANVMHTTDPAQLDQLSKGLEEDFPKGGAVTRRFTADTYESLQTAIKQRAKEIAAQARQDTRANLGEIKAVQAALIKGQPPPDADMQLYNQKFGASPDPETAAAWGQVRAVKNSLDAVKGQSPQAIRAMLAAAQGAGVPLDQEPTFDALKGYAQRLQSDLDRDPTTRAVKDRAVSGVRGLDFTSPQAFAAGLAARVPQAEGAAAHYGLASPKYLTEGEGELFKSLAASGGPRMVAFARAAADVLGPKLPVLLREVGGDAPKFAQIARVSAWGGSTSFLNDAAERQRLNNDPAAKGSLELPPQSRADPILTDTYGTALSAIPDMNAEARTAARDVMEVRALRENHSKMLDTVSARTAFQRTAQEAVGATFAGDTQFGGVAQYDPPGWYMSNAGKVLAPLPMRADGVGKAVGALTDADLEAMPNPPVAGDGKTPIGASTLRSAYLKSAGHGVYWVSQGDPDGSDPKWVMTSAGKRFSLDLTALEPALRARVPALYKSAPARAPAK